MGVAGDAGDRDIKHDLYADRSYEADPGETLPALS